MIISRSPLRITLGGGASDGIEYFTKFGGFLVAAAIDQYVYTTINHIFSDEIVLRYSNIEKVKSINDIHHPIIREALKLTNITDPNIEITSLADQPANSGLGSSGSFTTSLLKTLYKFKKQFIAPYQLAEQACHIEIDLLKENCGYQDQFIAAFGGLTSFEFKQDGTVIPKPLNISDDNINNLQNNLMMFSTGIYRSASSVLKDQKEKSKILDPDMINNLHYVKELGYKSVEALETGNLTDLGLLMNEQWKNKNARSKVMVNDRIEELYNLAINNGAIGAKNIGGGGGGYILAYTEERSRLQKALKQANLKEVPINFDYEGTKIL